MQITVFWLCMYIDIVAADNKYLMGVLLAASKKAITHKWLKQERPTLDDWIDVTIEIYMMEKITFFC